MAVSNAELADKAMVDIKKFGGKADQDLVNAMVKSYGLVMRKADSRLVACGDPNELETIKTNFLKKKLGMKDSDSKLDALLAKTCETMKGTNQKSRLTFYYLLVEATGKQGVFV